MPTPIPLLRLVARLRRRLGLTPPPLEKRVIPPHHLAQAGLYASGIPWWLPLSNPGHSGKSAMAAMTIAEWNARHPDRPVVVIGKEDLSAGPTLGDWIAAPEDPRNDLFASKSWADPPPADEPIDFRYRLGRDDGVR